MKLLRFYGLFPGAAGGWGGGRCITFMDPSNGISKLRRGRTIANKGSSLPVPSFLWRGRAGNARNVLPTKPCLTWSEATPFPLTPSFLGFLAYLQSLKGALPTFLGPRPPPGGWAGHICVSVCHTSAPPPDWCQSLGEMTRRAGEARVFVCLEEENLPLHFLEPEQT